MAGDTTNANNNYDWGYANVSGCQPLPTAGLGAAPEVVYAFTAATDGPFRILVTPTGSWNVALWVAKERCGDPRACIAGTNAGYSGPEQLVVAAGEAGKTYYVYVEGATAAAVGAHTIVVTE